MKNKMISLGCAAALVGAGVAGLTVAVGCKSVPSDSQMYTSSYAIGTSSGLIANMTKIDDTARNKVVEIVNVVDAHVPQTNETFTQAWKPVADKYIAQWVDSGEINAAQGVLISKAFDVACSGIDYLFNVRYPKARQYQELVEAATHGFCDGFLVTFKPANMMSAANGGVEIDEAAYEYLSAKYVRPKLIVK